MANIVFIASSLDGYIAGKEGDLSWLEMVPNPNHSDMGFSIFMERIDALVMGRKTYETVAGFGGEWPYSKPVFVYSKSLTSIPDSLKDRVFLIEGEPDKVVQSLGAKGYKTLYIDGGQTIQTFLTAGLIDEMIISKIPILLGGGTPLFGSFSHPQKWTLVSSEILLDQIVCDRYIKQ